MSLEALDALAVLRDHFKAGSKKDVPEGYKSVTDWGTAWSMSYPQSRRILERGVKEGIVEVEVFKIDGHGVKHYCVRESK